MSWDYIAGFIDGEGSIVKKNRSYMVNISQTNQEVLECIRSFTGKGHVYPIRKRKAHWKDAWLYNSGNAKNTYDILLHVVDKLIVKRELASRGLRELELRLAERETMKHLKAERIRRSKYLRKQGWTYRQIGKELGTDWGYARRLILST